MSQASDPTTLHRNLPPRANLMLHHLHCLPLWSDAQSPFNQPLVLDWDEQAGTVSGPGAALLLALWAEGSAIIVPPPGAAWPLGPDSLRSRTDMAALIGQAWCVPPFLVDAYPVDNGGFPDKTYTDADGVVHLGLDQVLF